MWSTGESIGLHRRVVKRFRSNGPGEPEHDYIRLCHQLSKEVRTKWWQYPIYVVVVQSSRAAQSGPFWPSFQPEEHITKHGCIKLWLTQEVSGTSGPSSVERTHPATSRVGPLTTSSRAANSTPRPDPSQTRTARFHPHIPPSSVKPDFQDPCRAEAAEEAVEEDVRSRKSADGRVSDA